MCNQLSKLSNTLFKKLSTVQYTLRKPTKKCCPSHVHCTILAMSTVQNPFRQPAKNCCPSHVHCNILLDKLPKNVVVHTTKSILAWKNVNKIKLHFELKQTWENFTIIELTIYYFFTYQKSFVFAGKHLYFQHMELVHNWT